MKFLKAREFWLILALFIMDQGVKWHTVATGSGACNSGGPWSVGTNAPFLMFVLSCLALVALSGFSTQLKTPLERIGFALLLTGGLSNVLDRLFRGCVVDYVRIGTFPIFNLADVALMLGILFLAMTWFKSFSSTKGKSLR